jgi:conjugative transfer signal peptidase TraF
MTVRVVLLIIIAGLLVIETLLSVAPVPFLRGWSIPRVQGLPKLLLWNASASAPRGLYGLRPPTPVSRGELVVIVPPTPLARYMAARGYLPVGVPLLKHVVAVPGETVCRKERTVTVDSEVVAVARVRDHLDRPLPDWHGCRRLGPGDVFVLNSSPNSFDSRYFGPLPTDAVSARAVPLWTERAP